MQIKLSRAEYWILESLVRLQYPIRDFASTNHESIFNKPGHGLDRDHLAGTLDDMLRAGWLSAQWFLGNDPPFTATLEEIETAFDGPGPLTEAMEDQQCLYCGLTPLGGSIWESFAWPEWNRFLIADVGSLAPGEILGSEKWRVQRYAELIHHFGIIITPDSMEWDIVEPWSATYWKTLPRAHRTRFQYKEREGIPDWNAMPSECNWLREWYRWH